MRSVGRLVEERLLLEYLLDAGADGVIFVANSDPACIGENPESVKDLQDRIGVKFDDPVRCSTTVGPEPSGTVTL